MNAAWDAFRIIENHSKSMIFMMPDDPKHEEYHDYMNKIDRHINQDTIKVRKRILNLHSLSLISYLMTFLE